MSNDVATAERMIRRRAAVSVVLAGLLIVTQGSRIDGGGSSLSWLLWTAVVLAFVLWGSGALRGRVVRALLRDEGSEENRRRAIVCGFWVALLSAAALFCLTFVREFSARDAIQVIVTSGVAAALLNFGTNEHRALGQ